LAAAASPLTKEAKTFPAHQTARRTSSKKNALDKQDGAVDTKLAAFEASTETFGCQQSSTENETPKFSTSAAAADDDASTSNVASGLVRAFDGTLVPVPTAVDVSKPTAIPTDASKSSSAADVGKISAPIITLVDSAAW